MGCGETCRYDHAIARWRSSNRSGLEVKVKGSNPEMVSGTEASSATIVSNHREKAQIVYQKPNGLARSYGDFNLHSTWLELLCL
jgi:hypothetical protein